MARFKRGDRVVVADREVTAADHKSGLYYAHFAGLHGVVDQVYEDEGEVCVEVDQDTLPQGFEPRHLSIQSHVRQKWLNGISDAERRGLSDEQKILRLKYTIMVAPADLAPEGRSRKPKPAAEAAPPASAQGSGGGAARPSTPAPTPAPSPPAAAAAAPAPKSPRAAAPSARRPTEEDLAAAEEAHFAELMRRTGK